MEKLFTPHVGLMVWTILTFLLLVFILGRFGWGPLIKGIDDRESFLKEQKEAAEKARSHAEELRSGLEKQLAEAQKTIQNMMAQAKADGEKTKSQLLSSAREESDKILEKGRRDLSGESDRLKGELRTEVAGLAVLMAEKILDRAVDQKLQEQILKDSLKEIAEVKK